MIKLPWSFNSPILPDSPERIQRILQELWQQIARVVNQEIELPIYSPTIHNLIETKTTQVVSTALATALNTLAVAPPSLFYGTEEKSTNALGTTFLKAELITTSPLIAGAGKIVLVTPTGNYGSIEAGWAARALIYKAGAGEVALAKNILDLLQLLQNADGSWYAQYNPYTDAAGTSYDNVTNLAGPTPLQLPGYATGTSGDFKPEIAAAMTAYAMADYDIATAGVIYQTDVEQALDFLRTLQNNFNVANTSNLLSNCLAGGVSNNVAILGNCALALLAMTRALTAYTAAPPLRCNPSNYAVARMANDLYFSLTINGWAGDAANYYNATYPVSTNTVVPILPFKEKMAYTQALCAWANYVFQNSAYWDSGGSGTVNTNGTNVTWVSGTTFRTDGSWEGKPITINAVVYTISSVTSGTALILTASAGVQAGVAYSVATNSDNSYQAERALDFLLPLNTGQWGGQLHSPYLALAQETQDEFANGAALTVLSMQAVNSVKYALQITSGQTFLKWLALSTGQVFGQVDKESVLWKWKSSVPGDGSIEGYGWMSLPISVGLLTGA